MLRLYRLLFPVGLLAVTPYYLIKGLRHPRHRVSFRQRFGFGLPELASGSPRIWIHAVSVG